MTERSTTDRLAGKTAIVTAASRGIGHAIAARLLAEGAKVCITARKAGPLQDAATELGPPDRVLSEAGRADDPDHQRSTIARVLDTFGRVDILVNNAGINPLAGPMIDADLSAARKIVEVNCLGTLAWTQAVHAAWMGEHGGAVLNVSSVAGLRPAGEIGVYGASKAMLNHLTQGLAAELAPSIRVNAIAPAVIRTSFGDHLITGREDALIASYPLKRLGEPDDVAALAAFLVSDEASWITGQIVTLDGGLTTTGGI